MGVVRRRSRVRPDTQVCLHGSETDRGRIRENRHEDRAARPDVSGPLHGRRRPTALLFASLLLLATGLVLACGDEAQDSVREPGQSSGTPAAAGGVEELLSADERKRFAAGYTLRGRTHLYERRYELAIQDFDTAVSLAGDNPRHYLNRALAYAFTGRRDLAHDDVRRAARLGDVRMFSVDGPFCDETPTSLENAYTVSIYRAYVALYMSFDVIDCSL